MISRLLILALVICFANPSGTNAAAVQSDSTKVVLHKGKQHIAHKVKPKETLYSLSRQYKVTVRQIVEANPEVESALNTGQTVFIPVAAKAKNTAAVKQTPVQAIKPAATARVFTADEHGNKWHTVAAGQTLFSIASLHSVSVEELKKLNNLGSADIQVGQKLLVGKQPTPQKTKFAQYVPEKDDDLEANSKPVPATKVAAPVVQVAEPVVRPEPEEAVKAETERAEPLKRTVHSGLAAVINTPFQSSKFLALHKTAPVGTMLQVKNSMNGKTVFVRVIGQLPETGENDKVIVKISKKAYQALGAIDAKFYAEVSYLQ